MARTAIFQGEVISEQPLANQNAGAVRQLKLRLVQLP